MNTMMKAAEVTGYFTAGFVSYVTTNGAFESKRGVAVFSPHKYLGLYLVDTAMGVVGAAVNYGLASCCTVYRASGHDFSGLSHIRHPPEVHSR